MNTLESGLSSRRVQRVRMRVLLLDWLSYRYAHRVIVLLGFVMLLPSLDTGLAADDYLETIMLERPSPIPGFERSVFDIYRFCDPGEFERLFQQGIFSWWDDPNTRLAFMRPLSALSHALDHALFPQHGTFLHLHSALWALLLYAGVSALLRALIAERATAHLALALYVLDDARGWLVSWVAARNAAIATALSVWCLYVHHLARRDGSRRASALAWSLFVCALLSGEGAIATCGYVAAYELFIARGSIRARGLALVPYAVIVCVWRGVYRSLDYGAYGSSLYFDPLTEPLSYLSALVEQGPLLLGAQFGGAWSDLSTLSFAQPRLALALYSVSCALVVWVGWGVTPVLRREPVARFAALGMTCAVLPAVAAKPAMDRLLTWIALGASVLLARLLVPYLQDARTDAALQTLRPQLWRRRLRDTLCVVVLAAHALGVVFLPSRARGNLVMRSILDRADAAIPRDPSVRDKILIFINPPLLPYAAYLPIERAAQGVPRPRAQHILAVATSDIELLRTDERTLRIRPRAGFLIDPISKLLWSEHRPFRVGERIVQADLTVEVLAVTADGRPLEIDARFSRPLDDPQYLWVDWRGTRSASFDIPATGTRVVLPQADYVQAVLGGY